MKKEIEVWVPESMRSFDVSKCIKQGECFSEQPEFYDMLIVNPNLSYVEKYKCNGQVMIRATLIIEDQS